MKTKEQILEDLQKENPSSIPTFKAMDEYAQQQAIAFIKWAVNGNALQGDHYGGVEYSVPAGPDNAEEAYAQFIEHQNQKPTNE